MSDNEAVNDDESLRAQHRKEKKELVAKIQAMKKTATKDKKKKIFEDIAKLEADMAKKHQDELDKFKSLNLSEPQTEIEAVEKAPQRVSKAQKRREKKEIEEREKRFDIAKQDEINKHGPRHKEVQAFKEILKSRGMCLHPIPSDGDCLYNAIRDQLLILNKTTTYNIKEFRRLTAEYIEKNKETLIMYMTNPDTNEILTDDEFTSYCNAVRDTPAWGGQIEITALANVLEAPIEVLQATGPPTITGNDTFQGPNLIITYHRHMYSLGEHYNSTRPILENEQDEDNEDVH